MNKIRTLVVDDEPLAAELVVGYVRQTDSLEFVGCCCNAKDAFARISEGGVDLVFLDIQMPGMSGITLAESLKKSSSSVKVVFTTAYSEFALDGFRLDAIDYLLKPFDYDEFLRATAKVTRLVGLEEAANANASTESTQIAESDKYFFVKSEYKLVRIEIASVCYVEGLKDYVKIFIEGQPKPVLTLSTMKMMESRLAPHSFIRLHRSFIVNVGKITGVERGNVIVAGTRIPVGDGYKAKFSEVMDKMVF